MMINYSKRFLRSLRKSSAKIQLKFRERLAEFIDDRNNPLVNCHKLKGDFDGYYSINVTGDWRALFRESEDGRILFDMIGAHSELYK